MAEPRLIDPQIRQLSELLVKEGWDCYPVGLQAQFFPANPAWTAPDPANDETFPKEL